MVLELLLADLPEQGHKWNGDNAGQPHGELSDWAARQGVTPRPALTALRREQPAADLSHPAMAVNLDACIQCNRCVRACREVQVNDVIGMSRARRAHARSCSTWTTPWAKAAAWPAANACRPAPPAR